MNSSQDLEETNPEEDLFYFETDHLALRGNKDYSEVLKTLLVLCAQREKAIKDYSKVVQLKKEALADPTSVLDKIIKNESLGVPDIPTIPEIPKIDWSKYEIKVPEETLKLIYSEANGPVKNKLEQPVKKESKHSSGRWTAEEQKRLEELLQIYPPEPIEMRRFKKIADALGNRTIQQVSSRVQKYFLKLYRAGLPIPGRIPKSAERVKKSNLHRHQRHNHYLWKPTTFFPELSVPVTMNDLDNVPGPSSLPSDTAQQTNPNYLIPTDYHIPTEQGPKKTDDELQLDLLRRVKREKLIESAAESGSGFVHVGYRCDFCNLDPIVGARWHCATCQNDSIDFCTDCVISQMCSENCHPLSHKLISYNSDSLYPSDSESYQGSSNMNNISSDDSEFEETENDEKLSDSEKSLGLSQNDEAKSKQAEFEWMNFDSETEFNEVDNVSYKYLHSNLSLD